MKNIKSISVLLAIFLSLGVSYAQDKPNVVIILADDLGYNDISCYRNLHPRHSDVPPTTHTPNIDKLAEQGMLFTDFYSGAAVCSPSRAALLTGRNSTRVGIYNWIPGESPMHLRSSEVTIAEMLKQANYQTGHFGKWHLTSEGTDQPIPNGQGFDYSFFAYNNAKPSHHNPVNYQRNGEPVGSLKGYACQLVVDEAVNWLEKRDANKPFYINVWFNEPHLKVAAPQELTQKHQYNKEYYGAIENLDLAIGRLMGFLKKNDLEKNTIVMFSSDNGSRVDHSNDPLRGEKCFNYEGGVRVPFIAKWNNRIPENKQCVAPGSFTDILPTIAHIANVKKPSDRKIDGEDISSLLLGKAKKLKRETPIFFYRYFHDPVCMLRDGDWCLLGYKNWYPKAETLNEGKLANIRPWQFKENHMLYLSEQQPERFELYNLRNDKEQDVDLANKYPKMVKKMKKQMLKLKKEMVAEGGNWFK
ncbi:arylsulfatase [Prolixibacteraceae bacterium JC049]|nr:arylsulfatase [Prolixibacteraceae bacterium JC049]